jgi:outer membrane protein assembly factor BamB
MDLKSGEEIYFQRTYTGQHRSSPTYADGHLYFASNDGHCTVVKTGRDFQIVSTNAMNEPITASPVISNGVLYIRSYQALYAIKK